MTSLVQLTVSDFEQVKMLRSLVFTVICGSVVALKDPTLDMHWLLWKKNHSKTYTSEVRIISKTTVKLG